MDIAIVGGTGDIGFGLALRLGRAGERVVIGSRDAARAVARAAEAAVTLGGGVSIEGAPNQDAVAACGVVLVTVPFAAQAETYRGIRDAVRQDAIVCDATSPLATAVGGRAWQVLRPWEGSAAEQARALLRTGTRLVSGFQTVAAEALRDLDRDLDGDVLLCGADAEAKAVIGGLVEEIPALRWADVGPLSMARVVEPLTAVLVGANRTYGVRTAGIRLTGRPAWGSPPGRPAGA